MLDRQGFGNIEAVQTKVGLGGPPAVDGVDKHNNHHVHRQQALLHATNSGSGRSEFHMNPASAIPWSAALARVYTGGGGGSYMQEACRIVQKIERRCYYASK